jgi:hypothetical protein
MLKSSSDRTATEAAPAGEMKTVAGKGKGRFPTRHTAPASTLNPPRYKPLRMRPGRTATAPGTGS